MANEKKSQLLGMPFGTASNQLRKLILFNLLERHGENICFQCNEKIKTSSELSIEHKKAWLNDDVALFWDLDNIGFSHLICNISAAVQTKVVKHPSQKSYKDGCRCGECRNIEKIRRQDQRGRGIKT